MLKQFPDNHFHAIITDPPAGIAFMGKEWDKDKGGRDDWIAWLTEIATECLRVIRPGGHAFVWALPRTSHWTGMAWENAGWEPRDKISHVFGQGFPKSLDISKALDHDNNIIRARGDPKPDANGRKRALEPNKGNSNGFSGALNVNRYEELPVSSEAIQWSGYGTALKPSHEDWWLFRKPLDGRVIDNIRAWGCGGINVDGCRISTNGEKILAGHSAKTPQDGWDRPWRTDQDLLDAWRKRKDANAEKATDLGRFPSNLILSHSPNCAKVGRKQVKAGVWNAVPVNSTPGSNGKTMGGGWQNRPGKTPGFVDATGHEEIDDYVCAEDCPVRLMNSQSGILQPSKGKYIRKHGESQFLGSMGDSRTDSPNGIIDIGGASRFFLNIDPDPFQYVAKASPTERAGCKHPTIKPKKLISYLVTLITPPGGIVLDPFLGSGTTGIACNEMGFEWVGIDLDTSFAKERLAAYQKTIESTPNMSLTAF